MKNLKLFTLLVLVVAVICSFASCAQLEELAETVPAIDKVLDLLPHEHNFAAATCTTPKTCKCGATEGEALGHTLVTDKGTPATCMKDGLSDGEHCTVCDYVVEQTVIKAEGHKYEKSFTAPTCTEWGYDTFTCSVCGAKYYTDTTLPLGHTYETVVDVEPTCTEAGSATLTCSVCGDTYTEELEALGHTEEAIPGKDATCTEAGLSEGKKCTVCGVVTVEQSEIEKLGHIDENLDVECDREGCTSKVAPPADSVLSLTTANALGSKLSTSNCYYVVGTIVEVENVGSGIFWIEDEEGVRFYVRLPKNADGVVYASWDFRLLVGDTVKFYGKIGKFTTSSGVFYPSMNSSPVLVEIISQHTHDFTYSPATCTDPANCECLAIGEAALGHIDEDGNNFCERCNWRMDASLEEINTHYQDIKDTEAVDTANGTATFNGTEFTVTFSKGTSSFNTNGTNHMRMNKNNAFTVSSNNGKKMLAITLVASSESYVDELELLAQASGYAYTVNGTEITLELDSLETVTLTNSTGKSQRIAAIHVTYVNA